jgi:hypothetical protein
MLDPSAQNEALHDAAVQMVGGRRAKRWVQTTKRAVSDAAFAAATNFPLMMTGMPPSIPEGLNPVEQIQKLIELTVRYIARVEMTTKIASPMELMGLKNVASEIGKLIAGMKGDVGNEAKMKSFAKAWSQILNGIKKLEQHTQMAMQKQQAENGKDDDQTGQIMAETRAKIAAKNAETKQKLMAKEASERQKRRHKDLAFVSDQRRENLRAATDAVRGSVRSLNE